MFLLVLRADFIQNGLGVPHGHLKPLPVLGALCDGFMALLEIPDARETQDEGSLVYGGVGRSRELTGPTPKST